MVEKGLGKEELALAVLIDFPVQLIGGWLAASWAIGSRPLRPYLWAFWARVFFAITAIFLVYYFPIPPIPSSFFWLIVVNGVLGSFGGYDIPTPDVTGADLPITELFNSLEYLPSTPGSQTPLSAEHT